MVWDAYAFIKFWLITTSMWVGVLLLVVAAFFDVPAVRNETVAFLLCPVRNQWVYEPSSLYQLSSSGCLAASWVLAGSL